LKLTAVDQDPRLLCLNDVTRTGYFAASCANEGDFHRASELSIRDQVWQAEVWGFRPANPFRLSPRPNALVRFGN
jgi:hypothetical protein